MGFLYNLLEDLWYASDKEDPHTPYERDELDEIEELQNKVNRAFEMEFNNVFKEKLGHCYCTACMGDYRKIDLYIEPNFLNKWGRKLQRQPEFNYRELKYVEITNKIRLQMRYPSDETVREMGEEKPFFNEVKEIITPVLINLFSKE